MAARTTISYLTKDQVTTINNNFNPPSERGFLYEGGLDFTLYRVVDEYEDLKIEEAVIGKAAYLWYQIASNQYFVNGNKRTAFETADVFLTINGLTLNADIGEKHLISSSIANKLFTTENVRVEIARHFK